MILAGVRAVLFDAVGTLIRPEPSVAEAYLAVGARHGSRLSLDEVRARFRVAFAGDAAAHRGRTNRRLERERWRKIVTTVFDDAPDAGGALFDELWQWFADPEHWRAFDDATTVATTLLERGLLVGVASNFDERLDAIVARWFPMVSKSYVFHSADIGWAKPDRRFYTTIEAALGLPPSELALVGDDEVNDVAAPIAGGWKARWLNRQGEAVPGAMRSLVELL